MRTTGFLATLLCSLLAAVPAAAQNTEIPARLSLAEAVRLVEQHHPGLAAARDRLGVARAALTTARQRPNPAFTFSSEGYRPWATGGRPLGEQEAALEVGQEIETAGRRRLRSEGASAGVAIGTASIDDQVRQIRLETQRAYFQLVLARSEVEAATIALAEVDKVIAVNRSRYQQGEVSGSELRRLEVERMKFTDDVLNAGLSEKNARGALLSLLGGVRLDAPLEPTDGFGAPGAAGLEGAAGQAAAGIDSSRLVARALAGRADLVAARRAEERAQSELQLQRAMRTPNVTLGAGYRRDFGANGLVVSASVPLPAFDRNAGGIARAEAERRMASSETRQVERVVSLEVQLAINTAEAMRARLASLESDYLQKAREARDGALAAYRSGATDLIDYLDAQRAFRDVQRAHQRALFDRRMSLLQLDAAVGVVSGDLLP